MAMKTYNDSYLYKTKIQKTQKENPDKKANAAIKEFIINSHRVVKTGDEFRGVLEDVKRSQRSVALSSVLMSSNVVLCINDFEMPAAFKVMDAKDMKNNLRSTVFIDVSGIIEYRNGFYVCKHVDKLLAYLFDALIYLLYRYYPNKILDNSTITLSATDCYVSLFVYILDYLRVSGYSANKNKIAYLVALFFLHNMMDKEITDYTQNIAAKVSGVSKSDINAYELYYRNRPDAFENIFTFINFLTDTFKLSGLNIQVFISKWIYLYGSGTEYASELYSSFLILLANAYSGAYINGQKQIDRTCKSVMVKTCLEIERIGASIFSSPKNLREARQYADKNTRELAEAIKLRDRAGDFLVIGESDFHVQDAAKDIANSAIKYCNESRSMARLAPFAEKAMLTGIKAARKSCTAVLEEDDFPIYENGTLLETAKAFKDVFTDKQIYTIETALDNTMNDLRFLVRETEASQNTLSTVTKVISEMMEVKRYI